MRFEPKDTLLRYLRWRPAAIDKDTRFFIIDFERSLLRKVGDNRVVDGEAAAAVFMSSGSDQGSAFFTALQKSEARDVRR